MIFATSSSSFSFIIFFGFDFFSLATLFSISNKFNSISGVLALGILISSFFSLLISLESNDKSKLSSILFFLSFRPNASKSSISSWSFLSFTSISSKFNSTFLGCLLPEDLLFLFSIRSDFGASPFVWICFCCIDSKIYCGGINLAEVFFPIMMLKFFNTFREPGIHIPNSTASALSLIGIIAFCKQYFRGNFLISGRIGVGFNSDFNPYLFASLLSRSSILNAFLFNKIS